MPFLSPSGSPSTSPRNKGAVYKFDDPASGTATTTTSAQPHSPLSITYIPPLIDGACGTTPNARPSIAQQLRHDVSQSIALLPALLRGAVTARMDPIEAIQHAGLAMLETYMLVSVIPLGLALPGALFAAWLAFCSALVMAMSWPLNGPGLQGHVLRSPSPTADGWTIGQDVDDEQWFYVGGMGTRQVPIHTTATWWRLPWLPSTCKLCGPEEKQLTIQVELLPTYSSRSLTRKTLPALARLFSRTIMAVHEPSYGLLFDFIALVLRRCLNTSIIPSVSSRVLYTQIRNALLDSKSNRTVLLVHNSGAVAVSHILRQLYADIPTDKMAKLEIYTFGAAAVEFVTPLGGAPADTKASGKQQQQQQQAHAHAPASSPSERQGPHLEHFAFATDPFARMGVLRSVHEDLAGRFCGAVFVLHCRGAAHHAPAASNQPSDASPRAGQAVAARPAGDERATEPASTSPRPLLSLHDYMSCLFPDHLLASAPAASAGSSSSSSAAAAAAAAAATEAVVVAAPSQHARPSILDDLMVIDRRLAEKREFAALAGKDPARHRARVGGASSSSSSPGSSSSSSSERRVSWTGLGATASERNANMDGVMGLEFARRGCRDCRGHRGREVSRLVKYVSLPSQFNDNVETKTSWLRRA